MRHLLSFLAAALLAVGISVFTTNPGEARVVQAASPSPVASSSPAASATAASGVTVDTKNFAYLPTTITISAGQTVTFKNSDSVAHTVTATDKSFDSGNMDQNGTWSHIFAKAGTYTYTCGYHAFMHGSVIVQ